MMHWLFLLNNISQIDPNKDTSFALIRASLKQGNKVSIIESKDMISNEGSLSFNIRSVLSETDTLELGAYEQIGVNDVNGIFIRKDPPFDTQYLIDTWFLDQLPSHITVINTPSGIRTVNEKVWVSQFKDIVPKTVITNSEEKIKTFLNENNKIILKPLDGYGGLGIFVVDVNDTNKFVIIESMISNGKWVIAQSFMPESKYGDKRILLLNGDPLGAVLRVQTKDHRNNVFAGGVVEPTTVTDTDMDLINVIRPYLIKLGLYFVGIDIIGTKLIEVNVTSPTCIQEMSRFMNQDLSEKVMTFADSLSIKETC